MSDLLNTLPGDIPGLLRRGSPVQALRHPDARSTVITVTAQHARVGFPWVINDEHADALWLDRLVLDLTDPTGRAHAAWWVQEQRARHHGGGGPDWLKTVAGWYTVLHLSMHGLDLTPTQIDTLARLVLRLAGRTP